MASTYSALKIELITTGEQVGDWGNTTNTNLGTALEEAIVGRAVASFTTDGNLTISLTNVNTTQVARHYILSLTSVGSLTATRDLIVPTTDKPYIIENSTSGGQSIRVKTSGGTGIIVPNGKTAMVYADSTNVVSALSYVPSITTDSLTGTGLTATRVPYASSGGLITDSANLTFSGTVLTSAGFAGPLNGTVGAATATTGLFTTIGATGDGTFSGTGQVKMPAGNTAQRSGAPSNGMFRYNSDLVAFEGYVGGIWSGVGGAQANGVIFENSLIITENYTLTTGKNGFSVGPITIDAGAVVTIPVDQRWVVL